MALAEQIAALAEKHELTCVGLNYSTADGATGFYAYAHGATAMGSSGHHPTPEDALRLAIEDLNVKRANAVAVPQLEAA